MTSAKQEGVMLVITLIVLVAMTLAGVAMTRSVDTANLISGNLAFQQAAVRAGDVGIERAVEWLEANAGNLAVNNFGRGYAASWQPPKSNNENWDAYWQVLVGGGQGQVFDWGRDSAGNNVSYAIQRLCGAAGVIAGNCMTPQTDGDNDGNGMGANEPQVMVMTQVLYRVTVRVDGPRSTVSYIQAIVAASP